jgi:recombination protein RecT
MLSFALVSGFEKTFYMTTEEIHEHAARYSKGYNNQYGNFWKDAPDDMEKKTVLRQGLTKWGYFDPHDVMAMGQSDEIVDDLPVEVTVEDKPKRTEAELLGDLGYDVDEQTGEILEGEASEPKTEQAVTDPVTREQVSDDALEEAKSIWVGDKTLGDHSADELTAIIENKRASETLRKAASLIINRIQQPAII